MRTARIAILPFLALVASCAPGDASNLRRSDESLGTANQLLVTNDDVVANTVDDMLTLFASDGFLYWRETGSSSLYRGCINSQNWVTTYPSDCGIDSGPISTGITPAYPTAMTAGAGFVYWVESGTNDLKYGNVDLGGTGTISNIKTAASNTTIKILAADRGWLYWIVAGGNTVRMGRIEENSSGAYALRDMGTILDNVNDNYLLAADRGRLYYKERGAATLYKARPNLRYHRVDEVTEVSTDASGYDLIAAEGGKFYYRNSGVNLYRSNNSAAKIPDYDWLSYVKQSFDTLIEHGTDKYGDVHTNLFMSNLDLNAIANAQEPYSPSYFQIFTSNGVLKDIDGPIRAEEVGRVYTGRLSWSGTNIAHDYPLLEAMYFVGGTEGAATKYTDAANAYIADQFKYASQNTYGSDNDAADGLFYSGNHSYYNAYSDTLGDPMLSNKLTVRKTVTAAVKDIAYTVPVDGRTNHFYFVEGDALIHGNIELGKLVNVSTTVASGWGNYKLAADGDWLYYHDTTTPYTYRARIRYDGSLDESTIQMLANDMVTNAIAAYGNAFYWVENGQMYQADCNSTTGALTNVHAIQTSSTAVAIAVGDGHVMWMESGSNDIFRGHIQSNTLVFDAIDDHYTTGTKVLASGKYEYFWSDAGTVYSTEYDLANRFYTLVSNDPNVHILAADGQSPSLQYWKYDGDPVGYYRYGNIYPAEMYFWVESPTANRVIADLAATKAGKLLWIEGNTLYCNGTIDDHNLSGNATAIADAKHVGASNDYAYWVTTDDTLKRQRIGADGLLTGAVATMETNFKATALAVEDEYIYWKAENGSLMQGRAQETNNGAQLVVLGIFDANSGTEDIAVRRDYVFWNEDGKLYKWGLGRLVDTQKHEFNSNQFTEWSRLGNVNSPRTRAYVDGLWKTHVYDPLKNDNNPLSGTCLHNRHNFEEVGHSSHMFTQTAGNMISGFAYVASTETDPVRTRYLDKAKCVLRQHTKNRTAGNAKVMASEASHWWTPPLQRWDMENMATDTFQLAAGLFKAYGYVQDSTFYNEAVEGIIKAYDTHAWNETAQTYYGMLDAKTGMHVDDASNLTYGSDPLYRAYAPTKNINMWRTLSASYEFGLLAAQVALWGFEISRDEPNLSEDPVLLTIANHWKNAIERNLPVRPGKRFGENPSAPPPGQLASTNVWSTAVIYEAGSYAENYARLISFYVHLHDVYNKPGKDPRGQGAEYLQRAINLAHEAIDKLWDPGAHLFRDHPMSPYYQASGGVPQLLHALMELAEATDGDSDPIPSMF